MKKKILTLLLLFWAGTVVPAYAAHGPLSTSQRDGWIDTTVTDLAAGTAAPLPGKPVSEMTNLEVAQWTAQTAQQVLAQNDLAPLPGQSAPDQAALLAEAMDRLSKLVREFRDELAAMGVDMAKLDDRISKQQQRNETFNSLQKDYLKRTGAVLGGYSRGYFYNFQGSGAPGALNGAVYPGPIYGPMTYDSDMFVEMDLKSIPAPYLLFDSRLRFWRTVGMYYADPLGSETNLDLRWLSLTYYTPGPSAPTPNLTAGDFYRSYTPLTLWNAEVPVYTFLEPLPLERERRDVEEIVFMDHGPDWHLRGFQAVAGLDWPHNPIVGGCNLQAMVGSLNTPAGEQFGSYYAGSRVSASFFENRVELSAQGLLVWDDPDSANLPYLPDFSLGWAREYQVGSLLAKTALPFSGGVSLSGSVEYAVSVYRDDMNDPSRDFQDWAGLASASVLYSGCRLTVKAMQIDPFFYSPGAQTNRYSALPMTGYLASNNGYDELLDGYLNRFPLQGVGQPSFAYYDRTQENMLPYGDATPNRQGILLGFSADIGKGGWLKPQASCVADMREMQPNLVLSADGTQSLAVDSGTNAATARVFGGFEVAATVDLAKLTELDESTYQAGLDFKRQTTSLGQDINPFSVNTFIASLDFNPPISGFDGLLGSVAYELTQSSGSEYVLTGQGSPPTDAAYPFYLDTASLGSYAYLPLNITKTTWVFGMSYPVTPTINIHGAYFIVHATWADVPDFDRWDRIWRFAYEASF